MASLCSCVRRGTVCWSSSGCRTPSTTLTSVGVPTTTDFNTPTPNPEEPDHSGHQCQPLPLLLIYAIICNIKTMLWVNCCYSLGYVKFSVQSCLTTNSVCVLFFFLMIFGAFERGRDFNLCFGDWLTVKAQIGPLLSAFFSSVWFEFMAIMKTIRHLISLNR